MPENLRDPGRNIRADVSQRTPDLSRATELADRYGDTRTANQTRAMDNANGGTRCWVMRFALMDDLRNPDALAPLEAIDEISLVAAPGIDDPVVQASIVDHCMNMRYRFAILDCKKEMGISTPGVHQNFSVNNLMGPPNGPGITDHGALYFPWISVFDPATALSKGGEGLIDVGPSGHMAGIYARVDNDRGDE